MEDRSDQSYPVCTNGGYPYEDNPYDFPETDPELKWLMGEGCTAMTAISSPIGMCVV